MILRAALLSPLFSVLLQVTAQAQNSRKDPGIIAIKGQTLNCPDRPKYPQDVVDRAKTTYGVGCSFCHGSDARGGIWDQINIGPG